MHLQPTIYMHIIFLFFLVLFGKSETYNLLNRGGDGSVVDQSRRSPLHYAVEKGLTRIVQVVDDGESNDDEKE